MSISKFNSNGLTMAQHHVSEAHQLGVLLLLFAKAMELKKSGTAIAGTKDSIQTLGAMLHNSGEPIGKLNHACVKSASVMINAIPNKQIEEFSLIDIAHMLLNVKWPRKRSAKKETADESQQDR